MPIQDLREWLERADAIGELVRVKQPVDRDEEMSAVTYLLAKKKPSPAVIFDQPAPAEANGIGARHAVEHSWSESEAHGPEPRGTAGHADSRAHSTREGQVQEPHSAGRGAKEATRRSMKTP
jgi:3-polyprenyl-4-hydroxybenzoate decarboxylase